MGIFTSTRQSIIQAKRQEREDRIRNLPPEFHQPINDADKTILNQEASQVVRKVQSGELDPSDVLLAYSKRALAIQKECNPLTEILIDESIQLAKRVNKTGPLAGFPVSLKDTVAVTGYDASLGYTKKCFQPITKDAPLVQLLKDAGALPYVKTNVPYTLLSFECYNDVWGTTENPHVKGFGPGGSTGGEACLLAAGGSRLGIGTDVAGSVRMPSHSSGSYAIKCSTTRFPEVGNITPTPGMDGIASVYSPMARTLPDLTFFLRTIIDMKPWEYDNTVAPIPWRDVQLPKKLKIGVISNDGVVTPSPACARALGMTVDALKKQGHQVVEFNPPSPLRALRIGSQLLCSDGGEIPLREQAFGEHNDAGFGRVVFALRLPRILTKIYAWYLEHIRGDKVWATLVRDWNVKTATEAWDLIAERQAYMREFFEAWKEQGIDFLITVPNATPALPHKSLYDSISSCGYTFLFNVLDYPAGILPVTKVDRNIDQLDKSFRPANRVERGAYKGYNADKMHGLPVGVEVVTNRLQEEKCLCAMELVESALRSNGVAYELFNS